MNDENDTCGFEIDFEVEVQEFIKKKYVNFVVVLEKNVEFCSMKIETLEEEIYFVNCSVSKGIQIVEGSFKMQGEVFESFEQLLNKVSLQYVKKFQNELFQRLIELQKEDSDEDNKI